MNASQRCKATQKGAYCLQQVGWICTARPVQNGLWDAIKRAFGVSEEKIMRHNAYKYAENISIAGLREQLSKQRDSLKPKAGDLNSDMVGDETMTNNMTAYRSWKIYNADVIGEREALEKEEKSRQGK